MYTVRHIHIYTQLIENAELMQRYKTTTRQIKNA